MSPAASLCVSRPSPHSPQTRATSCRRRHARIVEGIPRGCCPTGDTILGRGTVTTEALVLRPAVPRVRLHTHTHYDPSIFLRLFCTHTHVASSHILFLYHKTVRWGHCRPSLWKWSTVSSEVVPSSPSSTTRRSVSSTAHTRSTLHTTLPKRPRPRALTLHPKLF